MKKGNTKLTISVDERIKDKFMDVCVSEGLRPGKQIELFMASELKKREDKLKEKD
jgi:antitoxin component of RelBE/YafQ-DinJ toxin-antitoxin module